MSAQRKSDPRTVPSGPLHQYFAERGRGAKVALQKKMKLDSPAVITNWLKRGVPLNVLPDLCDAMGISEDRYRAMAGLRVRGLVQGGLDGASLIEDFEKLPVGLRAYIARKTRELRDIWEHNPILRDVFTPPKDPARYKEWEREIEGLIFKLRPGDGDDA